MICHVIIIRLPFMRSLYPVSLLFTAWLSVLLWMWRTEPWWPSRGELREEQETKDLSHSQGEWSSAHLTACTGVCCANFLGLVDWLLPAKKLKKEMAHECHTRLIKTELKTWHYSRIAIGSTQRGISEGVTTITIYVYSITGLPTHLWFVLLLISASLLSSVSLSFSYLLT